MHRTSTGIDPLIAPGQEGTSPGPSIEHVPELAGEADSAFITGFDCTRFRCPGTLIRDRRADRGTIVCSTCEHVYYSLREGGR